MSRVAQIESIEVRDCRGVRDITISLAANEGGQKPKHLILTGPNGSGKSGILLSTWMAIHDIGSPGPGTPGMLSRSVVTSELDVQLDVPVTEFLNRRPFDYYRSANFGDQNGAIKAELEPLLERLETEKVYAIADENLQEIEGITKSVDRIQDRLRLMTGDSGLQVRINRIGRKVTVGIQRSDGYVFPLDGFADGPASIDQLINQIDGQVAGRIPSKATGTPPRSGIVFIDELEAHLHFSFQAKILPLLTELFPTVQFIVATHSPLVISSIDDAVVFDLRKREAIQSSQLRGIKFGALLMAHFGVG